MTCYPCSQMACLFCGVSLPTKFCFTQKPGSNLLAQTFAGSAKPMHMTVTMAQSVATTFLGLVGMRGNMKQPGLKVWLPA